MSNFAADLEQRCRWAREHNDGHPAPAWSLREQLAAALVLRDKAHLDQMGYTPQEAAQAVYDGMADPPADMNAWLDTIRTAVGEAPPASKGPRLVEPDRDKLGEDIRDLAWTWARRMLGLGYDQAPFSEHDVPTPSVQARPVQLALLAACERLRAELETRAGDAARYAAMSGADYAEMGAAAGLTRQGARQRWPGLAELTKQARAGAIPAGTTALGHETPDEVR